MNPTFATFTGKLVSLTDPVLEDIDLRDVVQGLAANNRFNGQSWRSWSVAGHSVLVTALAPHPEVKRYAAIHDAHEYATGDITTPMKAYLRDRFGDDVLKEIEDRFDTLIAAKMGLQYPWPVGVKEAVKEADLKALAIEKYLLLPPSDEWFMDPGEVPADAPFDIVVEMADQPALARRSLFQLFRDVLANKPLEEYGQDSKVIPYSMVEQYRAETARIAAQEMELEASLEAAPELRMGM